jgi:hypothetical protein
MKELDTPVLFLIFNRPGLTEKTFAAIREARPKQLFVAADGPRKGRDDETVICQKTRDDVIQNIDWPCELKTLFRNDNVGCKVAVSSAISWFFEHVEKGIILEDDCLPNLDFFKFCSDMLGYYRDNKEIWQINGTCWSKKLFKNYSFTNYPLIWGWATWRDRWQQYDLEMTTFDEYLSSGRLAEVSKNKSVHDHFTNFFQKCKYDSLDTWDCQWVLTIFYHRGICICPDRNLISNTGCGVDATHTHNPQDKCGNRLLESNINVKFITSTRVSAKVNHAIELRLHYKPTLWDVFRKRYYYIKHIIKLSILKVTGHYDEHS